MPQTTFHETTNLETSNISEKNKKTAGFPLKLPRVPGASGTSLTSSASDIRAIEIWVEPAPDSSMVLTLFNYD